MPVFEEDDEYDETHASWSTVLQDQPEDDTAHILEEQRREERRQAKLAAYHAQKN